MPYLLCIITLPKDMPTHPKLSLAMPGTEQDGEHTSLEFVLGDKNGLLHSNFIWDFKNAYCSWVQWGHFVSKYFPVC